MNIPISLSLTFEQHETLKSILFPGDQKEAVAIALCGYAKGDRRHRLMIRSIHAIPSEAYSHRSSAKVIWSTDRLDHLLEQCAADKLSFVKIHSHPTGYASFSTTDDVSDRELLPMVRGWIGGKEIIHGSAVMLPDGRMFGRVLENENDQFVSLSAINVVGDDLSFWYSNVGTSELPDFLASHAQAFDEGTIECLQRLSVAVIGCSGTGSPVIEQLVRLGVGEIVLVDADSVERRNINRILNSCAQDSVDGRLKVEVQAEAVEWIGLCTKVIKISKNLWTPTAIRAVSQCDVVFGCMDSIDGRYLLNTLATYYTLAYFDVGIRLVAIAEGDKKGKVREVCGTVHYLQPGRSSLLSRGLYTMADVAAAGLKRNDPSAHAQQAQEKYISGVAARRPAVITVNMLASAFAVDELLARLHPFREEPNSQYASVTFSLASMELISEPEEGNCPLLIGKVGIGDVTPLLGQLEIIE